MQRAALSFLLALSCLPGFVGCSNNKSNVVAEVNDQKLLVDDFKARYKKFLESTSMRDNILTRKTVINNMINETLIFEDLRRQGLDVDEKSEQRLQEIKLQALLDGYSRKISIDTETVSEQELRQEFRAFNSKVAARYLYAATEGGARKLKEQLERGATFEVLAKEVFDDPGLANNGGYLGFFGWGEMEPALEEIAFVLPIGKISDPVRLKMGYALVKVEKRVEQPLASEYDFAKNKEKLTKAVLEKKTSRIIKDAVRQIEHDLSPRFNAEAVKSVFNNWADILKSSSNRGMIEQKSQEMVIPLGMKFVKFQEHEWSVGDFINKLHQTTDRQRKRVKTSDDVKEIAVGLAARDILLQRARSGGVESDQRVLDQIKLMTDTYLLKRWSGSVQDTVGQSGWDEKVLRKRFEENKSQYVHAPEVNVAEILLRTRGEGAMIMKKLKDGADFAALAKKYSIRLWAAKRGGELGFGTKADYGVLGDKFFAAKSGEFIGPEWVDPYYGVFKILARKEEKQMTFDEAKERIIEEIAVQKKQEVFKQTVENLRNRAKISVDMDILANIALN